MVTPSNKRMYDLTEIDPNFSLPPGIVDISYINPDEEVDSDTERDIDGEIVGIIYDEESPGGDGDSIGDEGNEAPLLFPPDNITIVSQVMRQTSDGRYVVDVVIDVEDIAGAINYEVALTKV